MGKVRMGEAESDYCELKKPVLPDEAWSWIRLSVSNV